MITARLTRMTGIGLVALLVAAGVAQVGISARSLGGAVATVALFALADWLAPAWPSAAVAAAVPASVYLVSSRAGNLGWFAVVGACGLAAVRLSFGAGVGVWLVAVVALGIPSIVDTGQGWPNWVAGCSTMFWAFRAGQWRIEGLERERRADAASSAATLAEERRRLARDLHDVVAHTLAVTVLHLGGARLAVDHEPADAARAIDEAERMARRSMSELREVVRVLADDEGDALAPPQPTAEAIPQLLDQYRHAGLCVTARVEGDLGWVSSPRGLVLFRVLQEALANASRHAPDRTVDVELAVRPDGGVTLVVRNPCPLPAGDGHGLGLRSMAQRLAAVGGALHAGPEGGCWVVSAELPP